jgi:hypothetical protein
MSIATRLITDRWFIFIFIFIFIFNILIKFFYALCLII